MQGRILHSPSLSRQQHTITFTPHGGSRPRQHVAGRVEQQGSALAAQPCCTVAMPQSKLNSTARAHYSGRTACRAVVDEASSSSTSSAPALPPCQVHDIIRAVAADGSEIYLEVVSVDSPAAELSGAATAPASSEAPDEQSSSSQPTAQQQQAVRLAHQGVIYTVLQPSSSSEQLLQLQPQGWQLQPDHPLVKALPGWPAALQQQQAKQQLPQQLLQLQTADVVYSAAQLQAAVKQNPAMWRDGTGPLDPPLQGLQYQTLCAGEIECLLAGSRGLVMVQLSVGWDVAAPQPVTNPLVLHSLQRALANKGISIFMSKAAGGLGLTAILCAKAEPWRAWAGHLASFGAQAALVADSPYYKLLIGRMLGYKEDNIHYHIQTTSGRMHPSPEVVAAVNKDMSKLSKKAPQLPWKADGAAGSGRSSMVGRGRGQQQQQQPRSARKRR